jgi:hypothetical protein
MHLIKRYRLVIAIFLVILLVVLFRTFSHSNFKYDAKRWAEPSVLRSNLVTEEQIGSLHGKTLIINLDNQDVLKMDHRVDVLNIRVDSLFNKNNLSIISGHKGHVLLYSSENYKSARAWMLLSQMGFRDISILTDDSDNEVLKNKFRPDTLFKAEL